MRTCTLFLGWTFLAICAGRPSTSAGGTESPAPRQEKVDPYGDPLPDRALARLGTVRLRHAGHVSWIVFAPNGKELISSAYDKVHVWDLQTGRELRSFAANAPSIRLSADGTTLATTQMAGPGSSMLAIWDMATGKEVRQFKGNANEYADEILLSPDGKILVTRCMTFNMPNGITFWDTSTGKPLHRIATTPGPVAHGHLAFAPDGRSLAGNLNGTIFFWDVASGKEMRKFKADGHALMFSPDGRYLAGVVNGRIGEDWGTIVVWDATSGKEIQRLRGGKGYGTVGFAFSADGRTLFSRETTHSLVRVQLPGAPGLRSLDLATGREGPFVALPRAGPSYPVVQDLALSPDGQTVALPINNTIALCDRATGKVRLQFGGHQGGIQAVLLSGDGKSLLSQDELGCARRWDTGSGKETQQTPTPVLMETLLQKQVIGRPSLSGDGKRFAWSTQALPRVCNVWDLTTDKKISHVDQPLAMPALSADGQTLVTLTQVNPPDDEAVPYCELRWWDADTGKEIHRLSTKLDYGRAHSCWLRFSADGQTLAAAANGAIGLWHGVDGRKLWEVQTAENGAVRNLAFSADGKTLATSHFAWSAKNKQSKETISLWEVASAKERLRLEAPEGLTLAFAPDGWSLASGGGAAARLYDTGTGQELARLTGHRGAIATMSFSADGKILASGSSDTTVLLWDVADLIARGRPQPVTLRPEEVESLWGDLRDADASKAFRAMRRLCGDPARTLAVLRRSLVPAAAPDAREVARLVADLDSPQFEAREKAAARLVDLGELVEPALKQVLESMPALEVRRRIEGVLQKMTLELATGDQLRALRAVELLERLGATEARVILGSLAKGAAGARLTKEAAAALRRLGR